MAIQHIFDDASRVMTVVSFVTFMGILAWTFSRRNTRRFEEAAQLPFEQD